MAWENRGTDMSFVAGEDLSFAQYRFVELNSSEQAILSDDGATGAYCLGILQNAPSSGEAADVRVDGISKLVIQPTGIYGVTGVAIGTFLSPGATGMATGETGTGYRPEYTKARMLDETLNFQELGTVEIISSNPA